MGDKTFWSNAVLTTILRKGGLAVGPGAAVGDDGPRGAGWMVGTDGCESGWGAQDAKKSDEAATQSTGCVVVA